VPTADENKRTVLDFIDLAIWQRRPREARERYIGDTYIQHGPHVKDGPEGFVESILEAVDQGREASSDIKRVIATEEYVVIHHHVTLGPLREGSALTLPGGVVGDADAVSERGIAAIDIFRIDEHGKICEHWDAWMPVPDPATSAHDNGVF
jgi:predicted SnoaL-like aldol condensation-catalyzing enzyme